MEYRLESKCLRCVYQYFGGWQIEHPVLRQCTKDDTIYALRNQPDVKTHRSDVLGCIAKPSGARAYQNGDGDTSAGKRFCDSSNNPGRRGKATELGCCTNFDPAHSGICCRKRIIDAANHHFNLDHCSSIHVRMPLFLSQRAFP